MHSMRMIILVSIIGLSSGAFASAPASRGKDNRLTSLEEMYARLVSRRNIQIDRLREYAATGEFPQNSDFPGHLVPYFVDNEGTPCAVGYLMVRDGWQDVVDSIVANCNHIRIEHVSNGPLLDWIATSGLTQEECAAIQPSYACIEDYRLGRPWQEEIQRLQTHFRRIEESLANDSARSLAEALRDQIDEEIHRLPSSEALRFPRLGRSLRSAEPAVRIGAAYAVAHLTHDVPPRNERIAALMPNLEDRVPEVRFWTAVALEEVGSASHAGRMELRRSTLPVFLETVRDGPQELRIPALLQLALLAPESMGSNVQLRLVPHIRRLFVEMCDDGDPEVERLARDVLSSWRWQRAVYESNRMRRHYLADSYDLECLAAEVGAMGRSFAKVPPAVQRLREAVDSHNVSNSITYIRASAEGPVGIASTADEASKMVDEHLHKLHDRHLQSENEEPFWKVGPGEPDVSGLFFLVNQRRTDTVDTTKLLHIVPRPAMLTRATRHPSYWIERSRKYTQDERQFIEPAFRPREDIDIVLGDKARDDFTSFTDTCDLLASFIASRTSVIVDRDVEQSQSEFTWSCRLATRHSGCRFFEPSPGGHYGHGSGGWEFHRLAFACDRSSGALTLSAEPIRFDMRQVPPNHADIAWRTKELRLMGWTEFDELDLFANTLVPAEYGQAVEMFLAGDEQGARRLLFLTNHFDRTLPNHDVVLAMLFDKTGRREKAISMMNSAAARWKDQPQTLADIARWELSAGLQETAYKHAHAALRLQPDNATAADVVNDLEDDDQGNTPGSG